MEPEPKRYSVFSYNGKDLILTDRNENFIVRSFHEIPHEVREFAKPGREVTIDANNKMELVKTKEEIDEARLKKFRHNDLLREIAGIEASDPIAPYAQERLERLRAELEKYEPQDPTAVTLEQKRANKSFFREPR